VSRERNNPHRYEVDTLRGRAIVIFILGFIVCLAFAFWIVEKTLRHLDAITPAPIAKSLVGDIRNTHTAPLIQPTQAVDHSPADDLEQLRSHEDDILAKLGWMVDRSKHHAVISDQLIQHMIQSHKSEAGK